MKLLTAIPPAIFFVFCLTLNAMPLGATEPSSGGLAQRIDQAIGQPLRTAGKQTASICSDATYARRLYLDLIGRIPTSVELRQFLASDSDQQREQLAETLLSSPEHAEHMSDVMDAYLLGRDDQRTYDRRREYGWRQYLIDSIAENRPWDQMVRDMLLARATPDTDVRAGWYLYERRDRHQDIAESVAPHFFGIRIECAQCHDHPLASEIQQYHYWGLVAFFNRGKNVKTPAGPRVAESAIGGFNKFTDLGGTSYKTLLTFYESDVIPQEWPAENEEQEDRDELYKVSTFDAEVEPRVPLKSRRQLFVDQVAADHPLLARAMVNRLWALLIGRGLVHPVDRMDSMHDPSHPELLETLAESFRQSGYDIRHLMRSIVFSKTYQRASIPADDGVRDDDFAYALEKPLIAEAYLRSINTLLHDQPVETDEALLSQFRKAFPDVFPETVKSNVTQSLLLTNGPAFNQMFQPGESPVLTYLCRELQDDEQRIESLYMRAFARPPTTQEREAAMKYLSQRDLDVGLGQLAWALVCSAEFQLNH